MCISMGWARKPVIGVGWAGASRTSRGQNPGRARLPAPRPRRRSNGRRLTGVGCNPLLCPQDKGRNGMCDEFIHPGLVTDSRLSRRSFGLMTAATAGLASAPALAQSNVAEKDVEVKTPDGSCDAVLFHPAGQGSWPAVLIWPDIMGLRP